MIGVVLTLVVVGVLLWAMQQIPMDPVIVTAIRVVVIVCVVIYLLRVFGLLGADIPIPRVR